ncbi:MAG: NAD(P)-dependent oxidoreductase [Leptolyngbyaceae bacterium]|nr:NAD(P)-dependent oxidoreductase [Leptolyngbyaceae bacterium]
MSKKILITGASGFLGWSLCQAARAQGWTVQGTYHRHLVTMAGIRLHRVDLTDFAALQEAIAPIQPDAVIHAAAQARPNQCELEPELAHRINVEATLNLAAWCSDRAIPFSFISTNQVFDGTQAPYRETDPVSPINQYGEQKVAAEQGVLQRHPTALICRMPLMFGVAPTAPSFLQGFLQRLAKGEPLKLFTDEFRTPLSGADAAQGILLALGKTTGCLHLGGAERLSRYEFGQILATVMGWDESRLTACRQADVPMAAARAADLTMDSHRARALGYSPTAVKTALMAMNLGETGEGMGGY